jgi:hypothetical protein
MACTGGLTKIWAAAAGSTFTQSVQGDAAGGFAAVAHVFEGQQPARVVPLPMSLNLQPDIQYFVVTHVVIVTKDPIDVQVSSAIGPQRHCTTITGNNPTVGNVDHTILVS